VRVVQVDFSPGSKRIGRQTSWFGSSPRGFSERYSRSYSDAYRVAGAIIAFGLTVKVVGALVATIVALLGFASGDGFLGVGGVIVGLLLAGIVGLLFWIAGVFVTAQGQLLRAGLDTAVNSSPFLDNVKRAEIMGVRLPST
jgi:hypothetical protein